MELIPVVIILILSGTVLYFGIKLLDGLSDIISNIQIIDTTQKIREDSKKQEKKGVSIVALKTKSQQQYNQEQSAKYYPDVAADPDLFFKDKNSANQIRNTNKDR